MAIRIILPFLSFVLIFWNFPCFAISTGVTDTEIKLGQSAAFRGTSAALGNDLWRGASAYFEHINRQGGVQGRKIRVVAINDGYEGDATLINTIKLITKEKVFALFGYVGTPTIVKALPVVQKFSKQKIFMFSNFTGAQAQREPPHDKYVFNIRSSYRQETKGLVDHLVLNGHKNIGVFIQNDAYGRSGADGVKRALKEHGKKILAEVTYERGTPFSVSMKRQVEALQAADVGAVISIGAYAACAAFIRDARLSGFNGPIANVSFVGADQLLNLLLTAEKTLGKKLTNKIINSQVVPPWSDTSISIVRLYQSMMDKYQARVPSDLRDPDYKPSKYSFVSLEGFINAMVFVEILKRAPKDLSRENFVETLESATDLDIGLGHRISFGKNRHQALDAVFYTTIKNEKYILVSDWKKL